MSIISSYINRLFVAILIVLTTKTSHQIDELIQLFNDKNQTIEHNINDYCNLYTNNDKKSKTSPFTSRVLIICLNFTNLKQLNFSDSNSVISPYSKIKLVLIGKNLTDYDLNLNDLDNQDSYNVLPYINEIKFDNFFNKLILNTNIFKKFNQLETITFERSILEFNYNNSISSENLFANLILKKLVFKKCTFLNGLSDQLLRHSHISKLKFVSCNLNRVFLIDKALGVRASIRNSLNINVNIVVMVNCSFGFHTDYINFNIIKNVKTLYLSNTNILYISKDFTFKCSKLIEIYYEYALLRHDDYMWQNSMKWMSNLNYIESNIGRYDATSDNNLTINSISKRKLVRLLFYENENLDLLSDVYICQFRYIQPLQQVLPIVLSSELPTLTTNSVTSEKCTCTVYWLYMYKYNLIEDKYKNCFLNNSLFIERMQSCDYEKMFNQCLNSSNGFFIKYNLFFTFYLLLVIFFVFISL